MTRPAPHQPSLVGDLAPRHGRLRRRPHQRHACRRLARAFRGKGTFRRFKDELYDEYPDLVSAGQAFPDVHAKRRAVEWLLEEELIQDEVAGT
jgi:hypothetical protein